MHELSIALNILDVAAEAASRHRDAQVLTIHLRLGALSGVVEQALHSAFDTAREGTRFEATRLDIDAVPVRIFCARCDASRLTSPALTLRCAACGQVSGDILEGTELEIVTLEISEPTEPTRPQP